MLHKNLHFPFRQCRNTKYNKKLIVITTSTNLHTSDKKINSKSYIYMHVSIYKKL